MKKIIIISLVVFLFGMPFLYSQKFNDPYADTDSLAGRGWHFGLNMGFYFPNSYTANFYNGHYNNVNKVEWVLENNYWYEDLRSDHLNGYNVLYDSAARHYLIDYQTNMRYDAVFSPGFYVRYNVKRNLGFYLQFTYAQLRTSGTFSLHIDSVTYTSEPALRHGFITGKEVRNLMDIGVFKSFDLDDIIQFYLEGGINMTNTVVSSNEIDISGFRKTIINRYGNQMYVPNTAMNEEFIYQGGIGFGITATAGLRFIFSEKISVDPSFQFFWKKANLEGYEAYNSHYNVFIRLILNDIL